MSGLVNLINALGAILLSVLIGILSFVYAGFGAAILISAWPYFVPYLLFGGLVFALLFDRHPEKETSENKSQVIKSWIVKNWSRSTVMAALIFLLSLIGSAILISVWPLLIVYVPIALVIASKVWDYLKNKEKPEGAVDVSAAVQKREVSDIVNKSPSKIAEQRKEQAKITVQRSNLMLIIGDTKIAFPYFMIKSAVADGKNVTISIVGDEIRAESDEPEELVREIESRIKKGYRIGNVIVRSPLSDPIRSIKAIRSRKGIEYEIPEADNRSRIEELVSAVSDIAGRYGTMEMGGLKIILPIYLVFDSSDSALNAFIRIDWEVTEGMKEADVVKMMIAFTGRGAAETIPKEDTISSIFTFRE